MHDASWSEQWGACRSSLSSLEETSHKPISQTTWLKVTPHCNHYPACIEKATFKLPDALACMGLDLNSGKKEETTLTAIILSTSKNKNETQVAQS
eukprot:1160953-Pelagomonas_calceolata.AAC.1